MIPEISLFLVTSGNKKGNKNPGGHAKLSEFSCP